MLFRTTFRTMFAVTSVTVLSAVLAACGSDSSSTDATSSGSTSGETTSSSAPAGQPLAGFQKVRPVSHLFTIDEVVAAGFKKSKDYEVAGLTGATAAVYGFYGVDPYNRQEYEIRFYASHDDAVKLGVPLAQESIGPNAKLTEEEATWDDGLKERRECQGNIRGSHHAGLCLTAKHQDFAVLGNMVVLCQGRDVADSNKHCDELFKVLPQS
jgi:hypothetical protein